MGIYRQATAPAYEAGGLWFDSDDNDKPYYGDGGSWVALNPGSLFTDFADTDHVQDADVLLGQRGAGGVNYLGSTFVTRNQAGNVGLATVASTWVANVAFQFGTWSALADGGAFGTVLGFNCYYNSGWKYKAANFASRYEQDGGHRWYVAASGAANAAISFTEAVRIDSSGNVGVGINSPVSRLDVRSSTNRVVEFWSTTSPAYSLAAYNGSASRLNLNGGNADGAANLIHFSAGGSADLSVGAVQSGTVYDFVVQGYSGSSYFERLRITNGGVTRPGTDNQQTLGSASFRWSVVYAGTGTINTSDEREKSEIGDIPDEWLDAWGAVGWSRFKFKEGKRWHIGLIAQRVHAAFDEAGLDAFEIGLCCYDEWEEQREAIFETVKKTRQIEQIVDAGLDEAGNPIKRTENVGEEYEETVDTGETRVTLEAGNRWGLRYDECFALEAAWQRREIDRLSARLAALEARQ